MNIYGYKTVRPMGVNEAKRQWPTSQNTLHIPLYDFMKLPCETPEALITTLKMQMRLHGVYLEGHDEFVITIDTSKNVVKVEAGWVLPF